MLSLLQYGYVFMCYMFNKPEGKEKKKTVVSHYQQFLCANQHYL